MEHRHQLRGSKIKGQGSQGIRMQLCSDRPHCRKDPIVHQGCFQQLKALKILGHIQDSQLQDIHTFDTRLDMWTNMQRWTCRDNYVA